MNEETDVEKGQGTTGSHKNNAIYYNVLPNFVLFQLYGSFYLFFIFIFL